MDTTLVQSKFQELLNDVRVQLLEAQIAFDTWFTLLPTEDNDILDTLNGFKGFFLPVRAAHYEIGAKIDPIEINEVSSLLEDLQGVFNDVYGAVHKGESWLFEPLEKGDTNNLLQTIQAHHRVITPATFVAFNAIRGQDDLAAYLVPSDDLERLREALEQQ